MENKKTVNLDMKQYGMVIALVAVFIIFAILTGGKNTSPANINNLIMQNGYVVILAVGMLLCVLTGNIDLGVGSVVACTEKVKVLEENWAELREQLQEALDDAILMGCTASQVKAEFKRLVDELPVRYAEQDGAGRDDR